MEIVNDHRDWTFVGFCFKSENDRRRQAIFRCYSDTWAVADLPYEVGDILWVRETWMEYKTYNKNQLELKNHYKTEHSPLIDPYLQHIKKKWTPSIHMPKRAARIFLKVKGIRVERLNQISDYDAIAEGIKKQKYSLDESVTIYENYLPGKDFYSWSDYGWDYGKETHSAPVASFCSLWEDINGDGSWNKNPFVWVIEFEKIVKPLDFLT
ncbi:hypothetical protein [Flavobacterium panacagri]|uniref:hypothetical protein n=1 Tax=Flavobacterium panacagri TaxID=3034146 RepID=UPI0025A51ECD|nr:hypothetical protein [Flavobacterium panacagri]